MENKLQELYDNDKMFPILLTLCILDVKKMGNPCVIKCERNQINEGIKYAIKKYNKSK